MSIEQDPSSKLTRQQLSQSRIIAKGRRIREINRLIGQYGGIARNWVKKSSSPILIEDRLAEIHWYEHQGIGRVEAKIKWLE